MERPYRVTIAALARRDSYSARPLPPYGYRVGWLIRPPTSPYKTLYCDDHKFWTMRAPLPETVLINRKQRMAVASDAVQPRSDTGTRDESPVVKSTLQLTAIWSGPFTRESVISGFTDGGRAPEYDGEDYGLYQIYGKHILCGSDTLLYIGQATEQTFSRRFRQHERWLAYEEDISVYLGRVYDPNRHTGSITSKDGRSMFDLPSVC